MYWIALIVLFLMAVPAFSLAATPTLRHGVNLSHWYAQWSDYEEQRLATYFTQKDVDLVAKMGFDHVRLTLDPLVVYSAAPGELKKDNVARLRQRIAKFIAAKVAVIVDLHPSDEYKAELKDPIHADAFVKNWSALAAALADLDPQWTAFEVMNEPATNLGQPWFDLQWKTMQGIRAAAPNHAIIADPGAWSGYDDLCKMKPYVMPNVIYTFHYYDPLLFTHQAASWSNERAQNVIGLTWPVDPSQAEAVTAECAKTPAAAKDLKWGIAQGDMTQAFIDRLMDQVVAWQKANGNPPVYVGEFGCYRKVAPRDAMLRWHVAVRESIEKRGWGWAVWDYAGGFSVAVGPQENRIADEEVLKALGLVH